MSQRKPVPAQCPRNGSMSVADGLEKYRRLLQKTQGVNSANDVLPVGFASGAGVSGIGSPVPRSDSTRGLGAPPQIPQALSAPMCIPRSGAAPPGHMRAVSPQPGMTVPPAVMVPRQQMRSVSPCPQSRGALGLPRYPNRSPENTPEVGSPASLQAVPGGPHYQHPLGSHPSQRLHWTNLASGRSHAQGVPQGFSPAVPLQAPLPLAPRVPIPVDCQPAVGSATAPSEKIQVLSRGETSDLSRLSPMQASRPNLSRLESPFQSRPPFERQPSPLPIPLRRTPERPESPMQSSLTALPGNSFASTSSFHGSSSREQLLGPKPLPNLASTELRARSMSPLPSLRQPSGSFSPQPSWLALGNAYVDRLNAQPPSPSSGTNLCREISPSAPTSFDLTPSLSCGTDFFKDRSPLSPQSAWRPGSEGRFGATDTCSHEALARLKAQFHSQDSGSASFVTGNTANPWELWRNNAAQTTSSGKPLPVLTPPKAKNADRGSEGLAAMMGDTVDFKPPPRPHLPQLTMSTASSLGPSKTDITACFPVSRPLTPDARPVFEFGEFGNDAGQHLKALSNSADIPALSLVSSGFECAIVSEDRDGMARAAAEPSLLQFRSAEDDVDPKVEVPVRVDSLDLDRLLLDRGLRSGFEDALKKAVACEVGLGVEREHVEVHIPHGSNPLRVMVKPPEGTSTMGLEWKLNSCKESNTLENGMAEKLACVDGISLLKRLQSDTIVVCLGEVIVRNGGMDLPDASRSFTDYGGTATSLDSGQRFGKELGLSGTETNAGGALFSGHKFPLTSAGSALSHPAVGLESSGAKGTYGASLCSLEEDDRCAEISFTMQSEQTLSPQFRGSGIADADESTTTSQGFGTTNGGSLTPSQGLSLANLGVRLSSTDAIRKAMGSPSRDGSAEPNWANQSQVHPHYVSPPQATSELSDTNATEIPSPCYTFQARNALSGFQDTDAATSNFFGSKDTCVTPSWPSRNGLDLSSWKQVDCEKQFRHDVTSATAKLRADGELQGVTESSNACLGQPCEQATEPNTFPSLGQDYSTSAFRWPSRANDAFWPETSHATNGHSLLAPSPTLELTAEAVTLASPEDASVMVNRMLTASSPWTSDGSVMLPKEQSRSSPVPAILGFPSSQPKSWSSYPMSGTAALSMSALPDGLSNAYQGSAEEQKADNIIKDSATLCNAAKSALRLGDTVVAHGRRGILSWDGRPEHDYASIQWEDDETESEPLPLDDIHAV